MGKLTQEQIINCPKLVKYLSDLFYLSRIQIISRFSMLEAEYDLSLYIKSPQLSTCRVILSVMMCAVTSCGSTRSHLALGSAILKSCHDVYPHSFSDNSGVCDIKEIRHVTTGENCDERQAPSCLSVIISESHSKAQLTFRYQKRLFWDEEQLFGLLRWSHSDKGNVER